MLEHAPEGPLAALSFDLPATTLASLVVGNPGTARRDQALGADVEKGLEALGGHADAVAYFDATAFYRETIARDGRPTPRGTVLLEAAVKDGLGFGHWLDAIMQHHWFPVSRAQEPNLNLWRFEVLGQPVEFALTASTLFGKAGEPIRDRASTDLAAAWGKAFDGAFGPGHVSALFDVGQLRRELMTPRFVAGVDPRRVVTAQAIAQTLLDGLTQLDLVVVDLAPDGRGAAMQALFRTRAVEPAP